ncbi:MAG: tautomerase family protein [Pseudomonadota bacterium]
MPLVRIEILKGRSTEYKRAILDGIHAAIVEAFRVPDEDRMQRIYELAPEDFEYRKIYGDQLTLIEITAFVGRSTAAKKALYAAIVRNLGLAPGIPKKDVVIFLREGPRENWGIRGGQSAADVDLGFEVEV